MALSTVVESRWRVVRLSAAWPKEKVGRSAPPEAKGAWVIAKVRENTLLACRLEVLGCQEGESCWWGHAIGAPLHRRRMA